MEAKRLRYELNVLSQKSRDQQTKIYACSVKYENVFDCTECVKFITILVDELLDRNYEGSKLELEVSSNMRKCDLRTSNHRKRHAFQLHCSLSYIGNACEIDKFSAEIQNKL